MQNKSKVRRIFSEPLKQELVRRIEQNEATVISISREFQVTRAAIYKWISKYSLYLEKSVKMVIQMDSEQQKNKELQKKIAELERALGRKQLELDVLSKVIEIASEKVGEDLKKKYGSKSSDGSEATEEKE